MQITLTAQLASCVQKSSGCFYFGVAGHCGTLTAMQAAIWSLALLDYLTTVSFSFVNATLHEHRRARWVPNHLYLHVLLCCRQNKHQVQCDNAGAFCACMCSTLYARWGSSQSASSTCSRSASILTMALRTIKSSSQSCLYQYVRL